MSPSAMKQMSWLSGLSATASPRRAASTLHLVLGAVAEREHRAAELGRGEHGEHVGLVLALIHAADQPGLAGAGVDAGVMTGADGVEAERDGPVEHGRELDLLVAAQARVGGVAPGVLGDEVVDDIGGESLGHVPHVERDADHVGGPAGVASVFERAAASGAGAVGARVLREGQMHAGHVVSGLGGPGGGDGGIDAS